MRLDPNSPEILAVRGLVLFLSGKLPQALQHVASALRLDPEHEVASRLRKRIKDVERIKEEGNMAFKGGKLDEAVTLYTGCLEVRNTHTLAIQMIVLISSQQRIGEADEEGKGGHIRATLLSNRATTLVKVLEFFSTRHLSRPLL